MEGKEDISGRESESSTTHRFMNTSKLRLGLIIVVSLLIGYWVGITKVSLDWKNFQPQVAFSSKEPPPSLMHADFTQFWNVLDKLQSNYYNKNAIDAQKILDGAISGMVNSVDDPYTLYLPPQQNDNFKQNLAGKFEGIGAELGMKNKQIIVVAPLDGSPAQKAGVKAGDAVIKVDGVVTAGWSLNQAVDKIRGPKGTSVTLTVLRKSGEPPTDIHIVRDTISVKSVTSWTKQVKDIEGINKNGDLKSNLNTPITYIRLSQFGDSTNQEWQNVVNGIVNDIQNGKKPKGIILDVRNNPGGYLNDAKYIASEFIKDGDVVLEEDRNGNRTSEKVTGQGRLTDIPVVVLLNKGSASAAEIVSGALRDNKRAILVGENSFGKGTVQEAEDLGGGAGLHITIAKWLTPNGTWVGNGKDGTGLKPDISVELDQKDPTHDTQLEKAVEALVNQ